MVSRKRKVPFGLISILLLLFVIADIAIAFSKSIWSTTLVLSLATQTSEQWIGRVINGIPGMRVDSASGTPPWLVHTPSEKYRIFTMVRRPNARSIEVSAYGPVTLYLKPWITHGPALASLRKLSEQIERECK
jgi:hypothetical protein